MESQVIPETQGVPGWTLTPLIGYLGSSNLTFSGLSGQGELNVDVADQDAASKLAAWFEARWNDRWCLDITKELIEILEESWAREEPLRPYLIYLKMALHLSQEARAGLAEFRIPTGFRARLFPFQEAAVRIAARHLQARGGVLLGDVVGLGKTFMATALVKLWEDLHDTETLILCPKNLEPMWRTVQETHGIRGRVLRLSRTIAELPDAKRYRLVVIDESHVLRNREGKTWAAVKDYLSRNESRCILLSATPYNMHYADLAGQLGLFLDSDEDVGVRPEALLRDLGGEPEFIARHQAPVRSLAAFEKSFHADDWRDLMRRYLVRRTRGFVIHNYAKADAGSGRKYLEDVDGRRAYFPDRVPRTARFDVDTRNPFDLYAALYSPEVVDAINALRLPRYGLGNYQARFDPKRLTPAEEKARLNLSRAGKRLMGFCRTGLFKRLESSGEAFLLSLERHLLRNFVFLHALDSKLALPVGAGDAAALDTSDEEEMRDQDGELTPMVSVGGLRGESAYRARATETYDRFRAGEGGKFQWIRADLFDTCRLSMDVLADSEALLALLDRLPRWSADGDNKLVALRHLLFETHRMDKVLIFTQFADTARYLGRALGDAGGRLAVVTGTSEDPAALAWRFSPRSNDQVVLARREGELRVLVTTDVLSEGQNLQDAHIVVNYDLPWAIIRLIQRVGRVDRIGQESERILAYSFLPAEGVEAVIALRGRLRARLKQNAEVVGTDEAFFEDDAAAEVLRDLYTEKSGLLDGDDEAVEVDLGSAALAIWNAAAEQDRKEVLALADVVHAARSFREPERAGALTYLRTAEGNDALAWVDEAGHIISESAAEVFRAAACASDARALPRPVGHHDRVQQAVQHAAAARRAGGGHLGSRRSTTYRVYERLKAMAVREGADPSLALAVDSVFTTPLRQSARDLLSTALRTGMSDADFGRLVLDLKAQRRLVREPEITDEGLDRFADAAPHILCSMALVAQ